MDGQPSATAELEHTSVISEIELSRTFTSFWHSIAPVSEHFVRRINVGLYERCAPPMKQRASPSRRAFLNEIAFRIFKKGMAVPNVHVARASEEMQRIVVDATAYIARKNLSPGADFSFPGQEELEEIFELSARISRFF